MSAFLCLHGAWHGAWVWDEVVFGLTRRGHLVNAPDLPGLGSLATDPIANVNLETHVWAVVPDQPVILVAHSYAGMIARLIADRYPARVLNVVLIEALWPDHGQCALDLLAPVARDNLVNTTVEDHRGKHFPPPSASQFHITDSVLRARVQQKLSNHPAQTFFDPVSLTGTDPEPVGTYVISTDRQPQPYAATATTLERHGWQIVRSTGGHSPMLTRPNYLINLLDRLSLEERLCDANVTPTLMKN